MKPTITWNAEKFGVEIKTEDEHFVISALPSMVMSWYDSVRYFEGDAEWKLPTKDQLKIVASNLVEVNRIINANGGFEIIGWHWTADESGESFARIVDMFGVDTHDYHKFINYCVRAVSALNN